MNDPPDGWGGTNKVYFRIKTFALEKANTIAIYEENTTFTGHYQQKERFNIIQLWVNDNNASTPFVQGPNAIVISTSLFANTKLNGLMQQERLMETPLYTYGDNFQVISANRDNNANIEGSTNDIDFVIIRLDISATDAMKVLDLLLTCVVNETLDETNQTVAVEQKLYTYVSTKINGSKAERLNLPYDVLHYIPLHNTFQNSPQGEEPSTEDTVSWDTHNIEWKDDLGQWIVDAVTAVYNDVLLLYALSPSFQQLVASIVAVIAMVVMAILTFLLSCELLWLIIRLILLILIYILLAIEIFSTVPIFFALGMALVALGGFMGMNTDFSVNWWSDYGEDTNIGFLEIEMDNFVVSMVSWIKWNYWEFFDLYVPYSVMDYNMDNVLNEIGSSEATPPTLHCGYTQIGESNSTVFDFSTTFTDVNGDAPEFVNVTLISPLGNSFDYSMARHPDYDEYNFVDDDVAQQLYKSGVLYNITVDFIEKFTENERKGTWNYKFSAKDDSGSFQDASIYPSQYPKEVGPTIESEEKPYLQYSLTTPTSKSGWEFDIFNFTVFGCEIEEGLIPVNVNLTVLLPSGTIKTFEMTNMSSWVENAFNNYSVYYQKAFTEYYISLNFSEHIDLQEDSYLCYYFDAYLTDGNHSYIWDSNEDGYETWFKIFLNTIGEGGAPKIVTYKVEELIQPRYWIYEDMHYFPDWVYSTINSFYEESVLRFWVWIRDEDGTHDEIYNQTQFVYTPKLTLTRFATLETAEYSVELDMAWNGYDEDMKADRYFVDLSGYGDWSYDWETWEIAKDESGNKFTAGTWKFEFDVQDEDLHDAETLEARHRIWHSGSITRFWQTMFGGVPYDGMPQSDDPTYAMALQTFGVIKPMITMGGFIASAALSLANRPNYARAASMITILVDGIHRVLGFLAFWQNSDPGAMGGFAMNIIISSIMYLVVQQIFMIRLKKCSVDMLEYWACQELTNVRLPSTHNYHDPGQSSFLYRILSILASFNLVLTMLSNPRNIIPALIMFIAANAGGKLSPKYSLILMPLAMILGMASSEFLGDPMEQLYYSVMPLMFLKTIEMINEVGQIPWQMSSFFLEAVGLGVMLNLISSQSKAQREEASLTGFLVPLPSVLGEGGDAKPIGGEDPTMKSIRLFRYFQLVMFGAAVGSFFISSGFGDAAGGLLVNTEHTEGDETSYVGSETETY